MIGVTVSIPHFRKPEKFRKRRIHVFRPTLGSGFSSYWVMVKYLIVMLKEN